jgi:hypothetical protein
MSVGAMKQRLHQVFDLLGNVPVQNSIAAMGAKGHCWNASNGNNSIAIPINLGGKLAWRHLIITYRTIGCFNLRMRRYTERPCAITYILAKLH